MSVVTPSYQSRHGQTCFWCVWTLLLALMMGLEGRRLQAAIDAKLGFATWLSFWDMETTLPLLLLLSLPVIVLIIRLHGRVPAGKGSAADEVHTTNSGRFRSTVVSAVAIFGLSLSCSYQVGSQPIEIKTAWQTSEMRFADLPPTYHDEYSYLLQARTFLSGRLSWPPMTVRPDLFHQFHVLNERRTISRYFPWTGLWMAPFAAVGHPIWGHWLAGAMSAAIFYLSLRQIAQQRVALLGGVLIAVSPGMALFSNLLLAHHPTMLALSVFTWAFFRMMHSCQLKYAFLAGFGLTLAMLARPMTAAGYAFPFGMWLAVQLFRNRETWRLTIGFLIPLLFGFAFLAVLNHEATGFWSRSAYQEYTERYTPRHRYGFNNAIGNGPSSGPPAVEAYDRWATNLTPAAAAENVWRRFVASMVWSLAIAPLLLGLLMALPFLFGLTGESPGVTGSTELRLLASGIATLHVVHVPYWFDGIMHWHYVFETAPLLLMLTAAGLVNAFEQLKLSLGRRAALSWLTAFVLAGLVPGWIALPLYNNVSKASAAISELSFSRRRFEVFHRMLQQPSIRKPALILVDETGTDPQLSYIINPPDRDASVLIGRRPKTDTELQELQAAFDDRTLYIFDPTAMRFEPLPANR